MAWNTKDHTWCRYCHFCIKAPMWKEKRWLQGIVDPPSYGGKFSAEKKMIKSCLKKSTAIPFSRRRSLSPSNSMLFHPFRSRSPPVFSDLINPTCSLHGSLCNCSKPFRRLPHGKFTIHYKQQWYAFLFTDNDDVLFDKRMIWFSSLCC